MRRIANTLTLCGVIALSACANAPVDRKVIPPVELLADCQEPAGGYKTNGELLRYSEAQKEALRGCNADKRALRVWAGLEE